MTRTCLSIVLAAGEGTRMRSERSKVLHEVAGLPLVAHVVDAARGAGAGATALVTGRDAQNVEACVRDRGVQISAHLQSERLGTGHAVLAARTAIEGGYDDLLVLFGDTPLITPETLQAARAKVAGGAAVCVVGFHAADPTGYGRLLMDGGDLLAIREHKDASHEERRITFCNSGVMALDGRHALSLLDSIGNHNAKGEYYLTDVVEIARSKGLPVTAIEAGESELAGVNTRVELAAVEGLWQARARARAMLEGVGMIAPETLFLSHDTVLEQDVTIEPNVVFGPGVTVRSGAVIHAFCHIEGAEIGAGASIGPFARLRPGTHLGEKAKVGNFCETKNAQVEAGAKINHLSYIGDATVGAGANIGAGTITCNYDGFDKHRTEIGADVFVGSNTSLVAPLSLGEGAYVGSGSVVTEDVPTGALAIGRGRQVIKEGRGTELKARLAEAKRDKAAAKSPL